MTSQSKKILIGVLSVVVLLGVIIAISVVGTRGDTGSETRESAGGSSCSMIPIFVVLLSAIIAQRKESEPKQAEKNTL